MADKHGREKFDFEKMKHDATHTDAGVRKRIFIDYFERFAEFPSYLFENDHGIDERLSHTIEDLLRDPEISKEMRSGIELLQRRLAA